MRSEDDMTIEALLTENNAKLGAILEALTKGGVPAAAASTPASAGEPAKRGRGRPVKGEEPTPAAVVEMKPEPESDESFLDDEPEAAPAKKYTKDDVRAALIAYGKKHTPEASRQLLKKEGGADTLSALAEDKYATVVAAASK